MDEIKISIILPSYNSEKYIEKAINSFLGQNYDNKELIIVDGKSTDSTPAIIEKYVAAYPNISWIKEKDINVTDAINIGLKYCTGDFFAFLAADVFYYTNDIFSTINRDHKVISFDGIYFDNYYYFASTNKIVLRKAQNVEFTKNNLLKYGPMAAFDSVFISKEIFKKHQYKPEHNLASDWEFFIRISQENPLFLYVEKVCTIDVQDGDNLSRKHDLEQKRQVKVVSALYNDENVVPYFESGLTSNQSTISKVWRSSKRLVKQLIK